MEDAVTDTEASVFPLSHSPRSGDKQEDHDQKEKEGDYKKAHKKEGHLFSRLIYGGEADEAEKEDKEEQRGIVKEGKEEEEEEEEESGGIITHLISNLVSPLSPKAGQVSDEEKHQVAEIEKQDSKSVEVGGNGGGIINNLISNLFHQSNEGGEKREGDKEENMNFVGGRKKAKIDKEGDEERGGGIIASIVSHLPTSLPDDAAPTTDEACILINSIVKD